MNYANIKNMDTANGPGVRVSLFVSGCTHHCKGCFNEVAWDFNYGEPFTQETVNTILNMLAPVYVKGLTLLGGEPFEKENQPALLDLVRQIKAEYPEKSLWAFFGYIFDKDLIKGRQHIPGVTAELLGYLDVLVDGPFIESQKKLMLRFRGSENQRLIDVQASLKENKVILWEDWQGSRKGL